MSDILFNHFRKSPIPINWSERMDKLRRDKRIYPKHAWIGWRKMEARRSQNAAYNTCANVTEVLEGQWAKLYH